MYLLLCLLLSGEAEEVTAMKQRLTTLETSIKKQEKELAEVNLNLRHEQNKWSLLSSVGLLNIIALVSAFVSAFWWLPRKAKKVLTEAVSKNRDLLAEMIEQHDEDHQIRTQERLLIIYRTEQENQEVMRDLKLRPPKRVQVPEANLTKDYVKDLELDVDLVIFDRLDASFINQYMAYSNTPFFVCYYPGQVKGVNRSDRINFANSPMTLYSRILETARYRRLMAQSKT